MVLVGGMGYTISVAGVMARRIANLHMQGTGAPVESEKECVVAGWGAIAMPTTPASPPGHRACSHKSTSTSAWRWRAW